MDSEEMKSRLKHFAINGAKLTQQLPDTLLNKIYKGQIIRSSNSAAANYRAHKEQNRDLILSIREKLLKKNWTKQCFFSRCLKNSIHSFLKN